MEKYTRTPNCKCFICGKDIYRRPNKIAVGPVYCSNKCYGKSNQILVKCSVCDNLFRSGLHKKTCSRACANKLKVGLIYNQLGKSNKDKVKDLEALRKRITLRDGDKCSRCEYNKLPILNVHHIIERSEGGSDELENLELLCPNCHAEEHYLRRQQKKLEQKISKENKIDKRLKLSDIQRIEIVAKRIAGATFASIAKEYGVHENTINKEFAKLLGS